jgi:hypothetical protein
VRFQIPATQGGTAYEVVIKLLKGLEGNGHCVVMDNFFCSIRLFRDLASKEIYTIGTIRSNRIRIPSYLKNIKAWRRFEHGHIKCVIWKNKCQILFISIHAQPISFPCVPYNEVPCRNGTVRENIPISHVLLEYIIFMRHIDIANQLRASYSSPIRSHE